MKAIVFAAMVIAGAASAAGNTVLPAGAASGTVKMVPTVGKSPEGMTINRLTHQLFIEAEPEEANGGGGEVDTDSVTVQAADPYAIYQFDPVKMQMVAITPVHDEGEYLAVNPLTNVVYHANMGTYEVAVIDASTHEVITYVPLAFEGGLWQPEGIAVDVLQNLIYVGAKAPALGEVPGTAPIPEWCRAIPEPSEDEPQYECWNPGRIFVIDGETNELALDADGNPLSFLAGDDPEAITFSSATHKVYAANEDDGTITVARGAKRTPGGILGPEVLSTISGGVAVPGWMEPVCGPDRICQPLVPLWPDLSACSGSWEKAQEADKMTVDPSGDVYITDDKYRVAKIDGYSDHVVAVLDIPGYACPDPVTGLLGPNTANNIAFSPGFDWRLYVTSEQDTIALVDPFSMTIQATLTVPGAKHIDAIATDPLLNSVYVTDEERMALFILQGDCADGKPDGCYAVPTCSGGEWTAEYYANMTLSGGPSAARCEPAIDYDWGSGGPAGTGVGTDNFSARWTRTHDFGAGGTYLFTATGDDGIRVLLDGTVIIAGWKDQPPTSYSAMVAVPAGTHTLVVEYYEKTGGAVARFGFEPYAPLDCGAEWKAEYFANMTFSGNPAGAQCESAIDYDWGSGGPAGIFVGNNNFSARWTQVHDFGAGGNYAFIARGDDGIRVLLDGSVVINGWKDQPPTTYTAILPVAAGVHTIVVEYYEKTGGAVAQFDYGPVDCGAGWTTEYFGNMTLSGLPAGVRCESAIDHAWGGGGPAGVPVAPDHFSARWTQVHDFGAGANYTFTVTADDGVRVLIDGSVLIDGWKDQPATTYTMSVFMSGVRTITVEYYENRGQAVAQFSYAKMP